MGVKLIPKHMILQRLQYANILSLIMYVHTGNMYYGVVPTVYVSIFLTKNQIKIMRKQHPQLWLIFITSLGVVLPMVEFHWNTIKYVTCVNKNRHQINLQKYTPEIN